MCVCLCVCLCVFLCVCETVIKYTNISVKECKFVSNWNYTHKHRSLGGSICVSHLKHRRISASCANILVSGYKGIAFLFSEERIFFSNFNFWEYEKNIESVLIHATYPHRSINTPRSSHVSIVDVQRAV